MILSESQKVHLMPYRTKKTTLIPFLLLFFCLGGFKQPHVRAQVTVTFNLDLRMQIEDGSFVPGRDRAEVMGDIYPLTRSRNYQLRDLSPFDSVYTVEITFARRFMNNDLNYNYIIKKFNGGEIRESELRQIRFVTSNQIIAPQLFDGYTN
jgi:hypothetical protein